ncbi:glycosyltransferase family 2 protein [Candidatus Chloroploca sp. Khr17]|uniref:glycosyltransferase family 2 protein n=1 Tax=Candidatus Chloroploca sp. Khr17 TaxID=2496869 RepID=UPI00101D3A96|nr:glycosyltransferase family 2 protein [Candidatus Chloroploca sp. Khr17]
MSSPQADVTIVIVNWNTRQLLLDCLAALPEATEGITAETWVVDNGSVDSSVAAVREAFPEVQIIANRDNRGFATANNQAIRASDGRHVLLLNSDTIAQPASITRLVHFLDTHPEVGIVGSRLLNADGSLQRSWALFPNLLTELVGKKIRLRWRYPTIDGTIAYSTDWIDGAVLMIRRGILGQVGLMDERYFMYTEEVDWCYRTRQAGWKVCYLPASEVIHFGGQSSKRSATRMKAELYLSKLRFFGKHYGDLARTTLGVGLQTIFLGKATLGGIILLATAAKHPTGHAFARDGALLLMAVQRHTWRRPVAEEIA